MEYVFAIALFLLGLALGVGSTIFFKKKLSPKSQEYMNDYLEKLEGVAQELMEARIQADQLSKAKSAFLANMNHEMRTPLNAIIGTVTLLLHTDLNEKQTKQVNRIRTSADILLNLINSVLDFSKLAAGELQLQKIKCHITPLIQDCFDILTPKADEKKLSFTMELPEKPIPEVLGDPIRFKQVILNISGNAIKFTEKGSVNLRLSIPSSSDDILITRVEIKDTGIGISKEHQRHLFERFWQADSSNTRLFGGTGLGLSITKEIVDLMGGKIGLTSNEKGTCFTIEVPFEIAK